MLVTPGYSAVFALVFVGLSVRTLLLRRKFKVAVGHGDESRLQRAVRAHANFAEYVPLALLLIFFLELMFGRTLLVHGLCITLLLGRALHAFGISRVNEDYRFRVTGMALTFTAVIVASTRKADFQSLVFGWNRSATTA